MLLLDSMDCDLEYILRPHSREGTILMFRNSGSNSLAILGLTREKLFPSPDSQRKSLSNWLIIPSTPAALSHSAAISADFHSQNVARLLLPAVGPWAGEPCVGMGPLTLQEGPP